MNGMFAFAIWDRTAHTLALVRDRLGIKPLYYGWCGSTFLFGSELKALCAYPGFSREVDRNSLALFVRHGYIPAPHSIYEGIYKLPPAHILEFDGGNASPRLVPYWSAKEIVERGLTHPVAASDSEAIERLDSLLRESVRVRMIADVPLGAFLSGGVDSSTVVALMQAQSAQPVRTFTIGFEEKGFDEAQYAKRVARHLGTEHTELCVTPREAQAVIPKLASMYDEPFSDFSQVPTFLVSKLTRQHVTVSLSGDGGDELYAGYENYAVIQSLYKRIRYVPYALRALGAKAIQAISPAHWDALFRLSKAWSASSVEGSLIGDKLHKLSTLLAKSAPEAMFHQLVSHCVSPNDLVIGACEPPTVFTDALQWTKVGELMEHMMYLDLVTYLPDDILTKVDRASMAVSLEARVPMLDHQVVEFAWQLPLSLKNRDGQRKWLLREVLHRYVPAEIMNRPKMGFSMPIHEWLRGPLRDWAESLLEESRLTREGFFHPKQVRQKWSEHLRGERNWKYLMWDVLMFQAWQERWLKA
jgi:asparagine synthase (glutamine-hydrolysing)